ncbi:hypothetical protein MD484_g2865, partial [Candolleomyces efflorescens]
MSPVASAESQPNPRATYDELFKPTYRFDELPPSWPGSKGGFETPVYMLGWLIRLKYHPTRRIPDFRDWTNDVLLPRWEELGFNTPENKRDGVVIPDVRTYGYHHVFFIVADNSWKSLPPMKRPEVRERAFRQALEVLQLDPERATEEKLRWFRLRAPDNTGKKPITYPHIYSEAKDTLPEWMSDMLDGSWVDKYPRNIYFDPEAEAYFEWEREYFAGKYDPPQQEDSDQPRGRQM